MKLITTIGTLAAFLLIPLSAFPQSQVDGESTSLSMPGEATIRYPAEETPLFAMLSSYSRNLQFLYRLGLEDAIENEALALKVSIEDMEHIAITLARYSALQQEGWVNEKTQLCQPILRGQDISQEYARESLARLDASDERNNAIAKSILSNIGDQFGSEAEASVTNRVYDHGRKVEFSKTDLVKFIEFLPTTDHKDYFVNECNAL